MAPDTLPDQLLRDAGLSDPGRARRILHGLAGQGVTDEIVAELIPSLIEAIRKSPDPDRALNNFERWTGAVTSRYTHIQLLMRHPAALDIFFNVCGTSQLFSDILIKNPEYVELLTNPGVRGGARSGGEVYRELSEFVDAVIRPELKLEAMRRFKQREFLRIGVRDILELAEMPDTAREFSNLADACVQKCLEVGAAQLSERYGAASPPFAVIAMGKLGGRELNYSSDIDLLFVADDGTGDEVPEDGERVKQATIPSMDFANRLAEFVVSALSRDMENGHLFRVDMRLRPEGRFGALVRSLDSYRGYYENWAEPWERQALLKARFAAGDPDLGARFSEMATSYVYRRTVSADFVAAIGANKERMEKKAQMEGGSGTNVKVGMGGIRDIEFAVQLLQLELGGRMPVLRTTNTLDALARLRQSGVVSAREARELAEDYRFLRTVEHRLQLLYELQTQTIPVEDGERRLLARRLGYAGLGDFDTEYARRTRRVRGHFGAIFLDGRTEPSTGSADPWPALLQNVKTAGAREEISSLLREAGFRDLDRAYATLRSAAAGGPYGRVPPEAVAQLQLVAAGLIGSCARSGDPDAALNGIAALAHDAPNAAALYRSLLEGEELRDRLCRLGAGSPPLIQTLAARPEWIDLLVSDEVLDPELKSSEAHEQALRERLGGRTGEAYWQALARYIMRERLRIGARELWGDILSLDASRELGALADAVIRLLLSYGIEAVAARFPGEPSRTALDSVAVVGLGKLGGLETGYQSDWDILIAFRDTAPFETEGLQPAPPTANDGRRAVNALAELLLGAGQELRTRGAPVELDARLRPEGRFGSLARTVEEYAEYYNTQSLTWERQTLLKARFLAGDAATGQAYLNMVHALIYATPLPPEAASEIRSMKRRMEMERLKSAERDTDLKLGHGGMSDIEFAAQLHQLLAGARHPAVRSTSTVEALHSLGRIGQIPAPDAARLADAYALLTGVRNRLALLTGIAADTLPEDLARLHAISIGLGFTDSAERSAEEQMRQTVGETMREVRFVVDRVFYGAA